jgi:rhamnulokinase
MSGIAHSAKGERSHYGHIRLNGKDSPPRGDRRALIAVDLGAESCRVSLLRWMEDAPEITVVHRFPNGPLQEGDTLRWNIGHIFAGVEVGLRKCAEIATEGVASIGVDGWAVDYVRLDPNGEPVANPFCYRDERTLAAQAAVHQRIPASRLYQLTGAQILPINTLYQLWADTAAGIARSAPWINLPEYVLYRLGAKRVSEFSNATHTGMLGVQDQKWSSEIFAAAGLDTNAAPPVVKTGSEVGRMQGPLADLPAFRDTRLIAPACHDTASAIAGIPAHGDDWAFISSGTWSLVGCVLDSPHISESAQSRNFSNEGGVGGKTYFLKNVNGMWLLRQCMEEWHAQGASWTLDTLFDACANLPAPDFLLDVDHPDLLLPGNMPSRINAQLTWAGHGAIPEQPSSAPLIATLIFHSLATRYAAVLQDVTKITGKTFTRLYIVGGGSKNVQLNRLTATATGLTVIAGPAECATIGNFAVQLAALSGEYSERVGGASGAVAQFAELLAEKPFASLPHEESFAPQAEKSDARPETERLSG